MRKSISLKEDKPLGGVIKRTKKKKYRPLCRSERMMSSCSRSTANGSVDFVFEIHAEEISDDPVRCIIPQVWISIMNLLNLNVRILNIERTKSRTF